jgi:hypothetical protein
VEAQLSTTPLEAESKPQRSGASVGTAARVPRGNEVS